jgi:hypothetical protein
MIFVSQRRTEEGHDTVTSELVYRPFAFMDLIHHDLKANVHDPMNFLGVEPHKNRGGIHHVRKKHCNQFSLPFDGATGGEYFFYQVFRGVGLWLRVIDAGSLVWPLKCTTAFITKMTVARVNFSAGTAT